MHNSAMKIGKKFLEDYAPKNREFRILEVGALDVNGSLREFQPLNSEWLGVDLESGKGVDLVLADPYKLPFADKSFDIILTTSVFEHSDFFWLLFEEIVRVSSPDGFIYINSPSNGMIHRYPVDVYRFYPDAGHALAMWGQRQRPTLKLCESFIADQDGDIWNDFVAIFGDENHQSPPVIYSNFLAKNVWANGEYVEATASEYPEDMLKNMKYAESENTSNYGEMNAMRSEIVRLEEIQTTLGNRLIENNARFEKELVELDEVRNMLTSIQSSRIWRISKPYRKFIEKLRMNRLRSRVPRQ
jgi:SAM-dependent methyltransferase